MSSLFKKKNQRRVKFYAHIDKNDSITKYSQYIQRQNKMKAREGAKGQQTGSKC